MIRRVQTAGRRKVVHWANLGFSELAPRDAVRMAYNVLLRRDPDPVAWDHLADAVGDGALSIPGMVDAIRSSNEYRTVPYEALSLHGSLHGSLHASRCEFITGLPPARRIIDLGGGHTTDARGALVVLGYPYRFEELVVVDLPPDERHPLYRSDRFESNRTDRGVVRYEYRSMDDLSFASDASVDLVYSGQSIEHVEVDDADTVLAESFRVLRPGGHLAIDTPNGAVCRLQQEAFIDPDHKFEYTLNQLRDKLVRAGFEVCTERGLNWGGPEVDRGAFEPGVFATHPGVHFDAEARYLLAVLCRRPDHP